MNIAATHSYRAEPDILIEVPRGTTKLQILFDTPARFSTQSIVTGNVAEEELVEKAVIKAGVIAFKWRVGFTRPMNFKSRGSPMNINVPSPSKIVRVNQATEAKDPIPVVMNTFAIRQKTP